MTLKITSQFCVPSFFFHYFLLFYHHRHLVATRASKSIEWFTIEPSFYSRPLLMNDFVPELFIVWPILTNRSFCLLISVTSLKSIRSHFQEFVCTFQIGFVLICWKEIPKLMGVITCRQSMKLRWKVHGRLRVEAIFCTCIDGISRDLNQALWNCYWKDGIPL